MTKLAGTNTGLLGHYRKLVFFNFHRHEADNYQQMREYFARIVLGEPEAYLPLDGMKLLDVGGAFGEFCRSISALRDCDATNLDPREGEHLWPRTIRARADQMPLADGCYDVVLCRGVLEHIPPDRQQSSLDEIYRVLAPGGRLIVSVPNFESFQASFSGPAWFHLDLPRHLYHFPLSALRRLLERVGFEIASEHHFSLRQNPFGWIQSWLNRFPSLPSSVRRSRPSQRHGLRGRTLSL